MVQIRAAASQEIKRLLHQYPDEQEWHLAQIYLTLEPGGCADWTYCLTAKPTSQQPLTVINCDNLHLGIPTAQLDLVKDLIIDYAEDLMGGGFRFINPLAQRTCGCGNAFALSADTSVSQDCTNPSLSVS
ncbi:iron-sulfur cluster assembly accessory protein [Nodosilinea sp. LEGE 07088]|uniref:HesB/IscA family protein n=1 Tax=Nodosilinea sp. LEGE 07088 TaxID=2777968 RepID=UPI00188211BA|nr:iron-sulfur cluster assembly accessory protein [Nodosilinea sp. LEGE 07088]MBE9135980.1 iron-sulfur cluster assembly accessory protein [Nodosilinea sp. LEGE 07088]